MRLDLHAQRLFASLLGVGFQLLQPGHFGGATLLLAQITVSTTHQFARQAQPARDLNRIAHAVLPDQQPVSRPQRFHVEFDRGILGPIVREGVSL